MFQRHFRSPDGQRVVQVVPARRRTALDQLALVVADLGEHHLAALHVLAHVVQVEVHDQAFDLLDPGPVGRVESHRHRRVAEYLGAQEREQGLVRLQDHPFTVRAGSRHEQGRPH
jgi:hypothetical protein